MSHSPMEKAAERMVRAALPIHETPSRNERIANFEQALSDLDRFSHEALDRISNNQETRHTVIVPLGTYATREALSQLTQKDNVDFNVTSRISNELQTLCTFLVRKIDISPGSSAFGMAAELGVANMAWAGIADGEIGLNYAVLMGSHGIDKSQHGLRGDVDLMVKTNGPRSGSRKKVQIKASSAREGFLYKEGITVIAAQSLVRTPTASEAVFKLLEWERVSPNLKKCVYNNFAAKLKT